MVDNLQSTHKFLLILYPLHTDAHIAIMNQGKKSQVNTTQ